MKDGTLCNMSLKNDIITGILSVANLRGERSSRGTGPV